MNKYQKSTPKKPIIKNVCNEVDGDVDYGACPSCEYPLDFSFNYCPNCGQALDWSGKKMTSKETPKRSSIALAENSLDLVARYCSDMNRQYPTRISYSRVGEALTNLDKFIKKHNREQPQPTLEEVEKEWEEAGWKKTNTYGIGFIKLNPRTNLYDTIHFHPLKKILLISFYGDENINILVLQLITKTTIAFRALGWEV